MLKNLNKFFVLAVIVTMFAPTLALGATIKTGDEVSIKKGNDIQDDLYIAGNNISVDSIIFGDLVTAGGNVIISENVSEDITAVGGTITILGNSSGDVRVLGGNILINGDVADDLIVIGGSVTVSPDVSIGGDLIVTGGQASIDGNVVGNVKITGGTATIGGHINGNVKASVDESLTINKGAIIDGNLEYGAKKSDALKIEDGAVVTGQTIFKEISTAKKEGAKNFIMATIGIAIILKLITLIIVALVLTWLFKNFSNSVIKEAIKNPLQMLGKGFVTLVIVPIASILLMVTLFGAPLGIAALLFYGVLVILSCVYAGVLVGVWANQKINKSDHSAITWKNVIGGIVLLLIVKAIPFIGWIIGLSVFLVVLGAITNIAQKKMWDGR